MPFDDYPELAADHGEYSYQGSRRLNGRRALITGGDSAVGAAVAIAFAREGASVAITRSPTLDRAGLAAERAIASSGGNVRVLEGSLSDTGFADSVADRAAEVLDGLDVLVNCASVQSHCEQLADLTREAWEQTFAVNVGALLAVTRSALRYLGPDGSIINTGSASVFDPSPTLVDYVASMGAVHALTRALALQLAPRGIRVNCVAPGAMWTPQHKGDGHMPERIPGIDDQVPLGRAAQPVELAAAYVYLASPESSYQTGSTIAVAGGRPAP